MSPNLNQTLQAADACIRCGACLEVCPLYQVSGAEVMAARGKLSLLQAVTDQTLLPSRRLQEIMSYCLTCGACAEICTAKVATPDLVKAGRAMLQARLGRSWSPALALAFLSLHTNQALPAFRTAGPVLARLKALVGEHSGLLYRLWPAAMGLLGRLPQVAPRPFSHLAPAVLPGRGKQTIAFFIGCGLEALFPQAGLAFLKICQRLEVEVITPPEQGCCGLLAASAGDESIAQTLARRFLRQFETLRVDYIVTACASCSYHLKRLPLLLADSREKDSARRLSGKIREASEFLVTVMPTASPPAAGRRPEQTLVFHNPCHLRRGQQLIEPPRRLLAQVPGVELQEIGEAGVCCGQGGIFGLCHPEMSTRIGQNTLRTYQQTGAATLATACSGCLAQLRGLTPETLSVRHFLEVLAEAV